MNLTIAQEILFASTKSLMKKTNTLHDDKLFSRLIV